MPKLAAVGEMLIDFTPAGTSAQGNPLFEQNPGGAPANVAVQAARLGVDSTFIGKVGNDSFGRFLKSTLQSYGVGTDGLVFDPDNSTTLAFVQLDEYGDRNFSFCRNPGADTQLRPQEIDARVLGACDLLHYGSLLFTDEPSRGTVYALLERARSMGKLLSYDPNWRPLLWKNGAQGLREMRAGLSYAQVLKISEEEMHLLTQEKDVDRSFAVLHEAGPAVIALTLGADGCIVSCAQGQCYCPTYDTAVVDTTGAGDSFFGAFLSKILLSGKRPEALTLAELRGFAEYANAAGALCAARRGAIPAMPDDRMIRDCMASVPRLV